MSYIHPSKVEVGIETSAPMSVQLEAASTETSNAVPFDIAVCHVDDAPVSHPQTTSTDSEVSDCVEVKVYNIECLVTYPQHYTSDPSLSGGSGCHNQFANEWKAAYCVH